VGVPGARALGGGGGGGGEVGSGMGKKLLVRSLLTFARTWATSLSTVRF
jgi:hypothetical protein